MFRMLLASIVVLLASVVALIAWMPRITDLKIDDAKTDMLNLNQAVQLSKQDMGHWPQSLSALVSGERPLLQKVPLDPWGHTYIYRLGNGAGFHLYSVGRNGLDEQGQGDDIINSEKLYVCEDYGINCSRTFSEVIYIATSLCGGVGFLTFLYASMNLLVRRHGRNRKSWQ